MPRPTIDELREQVKKPPRTRRRRIISVPRHTCYARCYECDAEWTGEKFEEVRQVRGKVDEHYNHTGHYVEIKEEQTRGLGVPPPKGKHNAI